MPRARPGTHVPHPLVEVTLLMGGDLAGKLLLFLATVYLARVLEPATFGHLALGQAVAAYLALLADGGLSRYEARLLASSQGDETRLIRGLRVALVGRASLAVVILIAYALITLSLPVDPRLKAVLILSSLWVLTSVVNIDWFWQGLKRTGVVGAARVLYPALYLAFCALFVRSGHALHPALISKTLASLLVGLTLLTLAARPLLPHRLAPAHRPLCREVVAHLKGAFPILLSAGLINLYSSNVDLIALQAWRTPEEAGIYAAAYRLYAPVASLAVVLIYFWYPRLCESVGLDDAARDRVRRQFAHTTLALAIGLCLALAVLGPIVLAALFGPSYQAGSAALRVLALGPLLSVTGAYFVTLLTAHGHFRKLPICYAAGVVAILLGNLLLVPRWGMLGSAVATLLAELAVMWVGSWQARRCRVTSWSRWARDIAPWPLAAGATSHPAPISSTFHRDASLALIALLLLALLAHQGSALMPSAAANHAIPPIARAYAEKAAPGANSIPPTGKRTNCLLANTNSLVSQFAVLSAPAPFNT